MKDEMKGKAKERMKKQRKHLAGELPTGSLPYGISPMKGVVD